jgi:hypothetical protein
MLHDSYSISYYVIIPQYMLSTWIYYLNKLNVFTWKSNCESWLIVPLLFAPNAIFFLTKCKPICKRLTFVRTIYGSDLSGFIRDICEWKMTIWRGNDDVIYAFNCSTTSFYGIITTHKCPEWMQIRSYHERVYKLDTDIIVSI